jgi:hypothetical protein
VITSKQIIQILEDSRKKSWETTTYKSWDSMKQRCCNKNNPRYSDYGGRGIKICDRWKDSYENFYKDMGARPAGTSLDRKDVKGDYTPGNCKWSGAKEQNSHTRSNNLVTYSGKTKTVTQWAKEKDINPGTLFSRLDNGWSKKDALKK